MLITILPLFLLSLAISLLVHPMFFEEESREDRFNEEAIKNSEIEIHCLLSFDNGNFRTGDIGEECEDDSLPSLSFSASMLDVEMLEDDKGVALIVSRIQGRPVEIRLVGVHEKEGHSGETLLEEEVDNLKSEKGVVRTMFGDEEKGAYRLIDGHFLDFTLETKKVAGPEAGFRTKIPRNWKVWRDEENIIFSHSKAKDLYPIKLNIKDGGLVVGEDNPYRKELEIIRDSLHINSVQELSDYRAFEEGLDEYIRIDTEEGEVDYIRKGKEERNFDILASGDPHTWNGTPSGLYEVLSKEGLRFSTESEVYMPLSMRMYGKYLIHGEAYYPSGIPYTSEVSGGCVRVRNEEMENLYALSEKGMPVLSIVHKKEAFTKEERRIPEFPEMKTESFLVADVDSGKVFAERNSKERRSIGDLTNVMTAVVTTEQMGVRTSLIAREYMLPEERDMKDIYPGRSFRLIDLLPPVLADSSHDATSILSHYLGRDNTVKYMNEKGESIKMKDTEFFHSRGERGNISTAKDIYYLAYYLFNTRRPILDITKGAWAPHINYEVFPRLRNKNLFYDERNFLGGKTGMSEDGHEGFFVFDMEIEGEERTVIFVLLGSESRASLESEVKELKNWLRSSYEL